MTVNAGIRVEHENVPLLVVWPSLPAIYRLISAGAAKIAPRIGAAWDVFQDGRLKVFGSYGVFNDQMKLNLALGSFGGQWWNNCFYAMNDPKLTIFSLSLARAAVIAPVPVAVPPPTLHWAAHGSNTFNYNENYRQPVPGLSYFGPNLKPYRQHETVFGPITRSRKILLSKCAGIVVASIT